MATSKQSQAWKPARLEASDPPRLFLVVTLPQQKETHSSQGAIFENITFMTIRKCNSEMHRTLLTKNYFSKFGRYNIPDKQKQKSDSKSDKT